MSAWYVFGTLGFYPVDPASGVYVLGVPRFDAARLRVQGGAFTVRAHRSGPADLYVTAVRLNGRPWPFTYVRHSDVAAGGVLDIDLGPEPDPEWGRALWSRPPGDSDSPDLLEARRRAEATAGI
jgi:putative alpha-1,2-mannosidase